MVPNRKEQEERSYLAGYTYNIRKKTMMAKPSIAFTESFASEAKIADDIPREDVIRVLKFLRGVGISDPAPDEFDAKKDTYSDIIRGLLKPLHISPGRVICLVSVKPAVTNFYSGFHGGAIAAVAEAVSMACARTLVAKDKELFLGELSISYLSSATKDEEVRVDASVVRSGRNLSVIALEWKLMKTGRLVYTARATFYHTPVAKL